LVPAFGLVQEAAPAGTERQASEDLAAGKSGRFGGGIMTSKELVEIAGITRRMLQWWIRQGLIKPRRRRQPFAGRGDQFWFEDADVFRALIIRELRAKGIRRDRIQRWKLTPPEGDYLLIMGSRIAWTGQRSLIQKLEELKAPVMLVSIYDLRMELRAVMERRDRRAAA
jgi:DNA-binding transcriptional MerR regulator